MSEHDISSTNGHSRIAIRQLGEVVVAEWLGESPYTLISQEQMHEADKPAWFTRDGDRVTVCQFQLRILGRDPNGDYVLERVDSAPAAAGAA